MSSFIAADADGNEYCIIRSARTGKYGSGGFAQSYVKGWDLSTECGLNVDWIKKGVYDIIDVEGDRIRVTSSDPNAP